MSLLIKALNKAEEAQAKNIKTEQVEAEKAAAKTATRLSTEAANKPQTKPNESPAKFESADMVLSLSPTDSLFSESVKPVTAPAVAKVEASTVKTTTSQQASSQQIAAKNAANVFTAKGLESKTDSARIAIIAGAGLIALLAMGLYFYQFVDNSPPVMLPVRPLEQLAAAPEPVAPLNENTTVETSVTSSELTETAEPQIPQAIEPAAPIQVAEKRENLDKRKSAKKSSKALFEQDSQDQISQDQISQDQNFQEEALQDRADLTPAELSDDEVIVADNAEEMTQPATTVKSNKKMRKSKTNAAIASESASIQVSRSTAQSGVSPALMSAYEAYNAGNDKEAIKLYKQVLQRDIRNIDALLGLGVIATRQGRAADANGWYGKVLEVDPRNNIARAAVLDSQSQGNEQANETSLKNMLAKQPNDANLHVALGNLYAEQNQWPAAQQAYFDAYSLNKNADNAYNLAVSLDQMGKPKLALPYYQRALEQASNASSIDKAALEARIAAIK